MSDVSGANLDRLNDLLASRAMRRLSPQESSELDTLLAAHPEVDDLAFDRAAAVLDLASLEIEPMPPHLADALKSSAAAWLAGR